MFKKLLICSDLSDASNALINCVGQLKNAGVEEALLLHVVYETIPFETEEVQLERLKPIIDENHPTSQAILDKLENQRSILEAAGIKTVIKTVHGIPSQVITEEAEKQKASAIFMGTHGKGILKRATIGSVSSEVLTMTRIPVFLVKTTISKDEVTLACKRMFNRILYLTDFSKTAVRALDYVEKLVGDLKVPVTILHVQDTVDIDGLIHSVPELDPKAIKDIQDKNTKAVENDLVSIKTKLEAAGAANVDYQLAKGRPIDVIMKTIEDNKDLSLVVMGSQGKGFVKELFMGSLSLQVTRYSPIPVLLIPAKS